MSLLLFVSFFSLFAFIHASLKSTTPESRFAFNEYLLRIRVNNNKDDSQDVYLNGYGELRLAKQ